MSILSIVQGSHSLKNKIIVREKQRKEQQYLSTNKIHNFVKIRRSIKKLTLTLSWLQSMMFLTKELVIYRFRDLFSLLRVMKLEWEISGISFRIPKKEEMSFHILRSSRAAESFSAGFSFSVRFSFSEEGAIFSSVSSEAFLSS